MNKLLPLAALALLGLAHCKSNAPAPAPPQDPLAQLPAETQTGAKTFGCLLNGQAWTPAGSPLGGPLFITQYYNQQLTLSASRAITINGVSTDQSIAINASKVSVPGVYTLASSTGDFADIIDLITRCSYYTSSTAIGTLEVTRLDLVNRIVSGRFAFTLETPGCGRMVVTDGRFDSRF